MATTVTPLPQLDRAAPDFRQQTNLFFGSQLPTFTVQINQVSFELMTARDQAVAARDEAVPLANQVITLAPQAIAASNNVSVLAPQVAQNAQIAETARANAVAAAAQATAVNMGGSTGWPAFPPSMLNDWANSRYLSTAFSRQRSSTATYIDRMGRLRTAANGEPVFEWDATGRCRGLRVEPSRTNYARNTLAIGGAAGAFPTNWTSETPGLPAGVTVSAVGLRVIDGITYFGTRYAGTPANASGYGALTPGAETAGQSRMVSATVGQQFTGSAWVFVEGSVGGARTSLVTRAGSTAADKNKRVETITTPTRVITDPATAITAGDGRVFLLTDFLSVAALDFTIWIGGAQFENGPSATSLILNGLAGAATRPADVITLPAAAAVDVLNPAQGAFLVEFTLNALPTGASYAYVLSLNNGTTGEIMLIRVESAAGLTAYVVSQGNQRAYINPSAGPLVAGQRYRLAIAYSSTGMRGSLNGAAISAGGGYAPGFTPPALWDRLNVGNDFGASGLNGHIASLLAYPRIPSDPELRAMSAL